jgi:hypothetical protein
MREEKSLIRLELKLSRRNSQDRIQHRRGYRAIGRLADEIAFAETSTGWESGKAKHDHLRQKEKQELEADIRNM